MVRAGALVKWLWETTRVQEVVGLNLSTGRTILSLICGKIVIFVCLKRPKINEKEVGMAHLLEKTAERQTVQIRSTGPFAFAQNVPKKEKA